MYNALGNKHEGNAKNMELPLCSPSDVNLNIISGSSSSNMQSSPAVILRPSKQEGWPHRYIQTPFGQNCCARLAHQTGCGEKENIHLHILKAEERRMVSRAYEFPWSVLGNGRLSTKFFLPGSGLQRGKGGHLMQHTLLAPQCAQFSEWMHKRECKVQGGGPQKKASKPADCALKP